MARTTAASLMLTLWLSTVAAAVSPEIHHFFHHESDASAHQCLLSLINKGEFLADTPESLAPAAPLLLALVPAPLAATTPSRADVRLTPSRAPPAVVGFIQREGFVRGA